jgi:hypothetical protein
VKAVVFKEEVLGLTMEIVEVIRDGSKESP